MEAALSRQANPLAALLDAQVDAHHAGVCDDDVAILQNIGERIADFAAELAAHLARVSDARMVTKYVGQGERRAAKVFNTEELALELAEGALGELDAFPVVRTAAELRLSRAVRLEADAPARPATHRLSVAA